MRRRAKPKAKTRSPRRASKRAPKAPKTLLEMIEDPDFLLRAFRGIQYAVKLAADRERAAKTKRTIAGRSK